MKRAYERPLMTAERFIPNEYVAACWGVACVLPETNGGHDTSPSYTWEWVNGRYTRVENNTHAKNSDGTGCGHAANQYIIQTATGFKMTEVNTSGLGDLVCTVTNYTDADGNGLPDDGSMIYWNTSSGNRTWHHQGIVNLSDASRPNHS